LKLPGLKEVRELHGWSQRDLAEAAGVSRDSISNYETGQREAWPTTAKRLADALSVEIEDLARPKAPAPSMPGQPERKRPIFDLVRDALLRQAEQDRQAFTRAAESSFVQPYWKRHENEILARLLEYDPTGELAEAYIELMWRFVESEQERERLTREVETLRHRLEEVGV
jgi:transcriptional regulator with XRE-family HTH domain